MPNVRDCSVCGETTPEWIILARKVHHTDPRYCIAVNGMKELIAWGK